MAGSVPVCCTFAAQEQQHCPIYVQVGKCPAVRPPHLDCVRSMSYIGMPCISDGLCMGYLSREESCM